MRTVAATKRVNGLSEIFQNNKTEFALSRYDERKKVLIQCHQFVHCRDFMLDALTGAEENKTMGIYGFQYHKEDPRPDVENCSLLLRLENDGALKNFNDNLPILKDIEDEMGWATSYTEVVDFPDKKSIVVHVLGDAMWVQSALAFSFYTFLLKCMTYKFKDKTKWMEEIKAAGTTESGYVDVAYFNHLFQNLPDLVAQFSNFSGWKNQKEIGIGTLHNYSGFVSLKNMIMTKKVMKPFDQHMLSDYVGKAGQCAA